MHTFTITVNPINDAPSFTIVTPPPASTEDGGTQTVSDFAGAISEGPNESEQLLTFALSPTGTTGTLAFSSGPFIDGDSGVLTYTAAPNTYGTVTFNVTLLDSGASAPPNANASSTQSFTITVDAVNDAPSFTLPSAAPAVDEDAGAQSIANFATAISAGPSDESGQTLAFSVTQTSSDATLTFSVAPSIAPDGTLTYTPDANAYGSATFDVVLVDDGASTAPEREQLDVHTFTITVNPINDAPSFTTVTPPPASTEDGGTQTVNGFASAISQGPNESSQTLTFVLTQTATTSALAFSSGPSIDPTTGALTYTAAPNAYGTATFDVVLTDSGSNTPPNANASSTQPFTITVDALNDAPTFTLPSAAPTISEDAGAQSIPNFATAISAGTVG